MSIRLRILFWTCTHRALSWASFWLGYGATLSELRKAKARTAHRRWIIEL